MRLTMKKHGNAVWRDNHSARNDKGCEKPKGASDDTMTLPLVGKKENLNILILCFHCLQF